MQFLTAATIMSVNMEVFGAYLGLYYEALGGGPNTLPQQVPCMIPMLPNDAILAFCWIYVRKYQSQRESEVVSTVTAIFSLAVALITSALLPVDIFLVSYMKNQNGTFKEWANANVSVQIENTVLYGYYTTAACPGLEPQIGDWGSVRQARPQGSSRRTAQLQALILVPNGKQWQQKALDSSSPALYSVILFCVFFWIPFVYFYYEEKDDDDTSKCTQVKTALKYTVGFVVICALLLLVGAFVPLNLPSNKNSTEWEKVKFLFEELGSSHGLAALSFSISSLTLIGMLAAITYTAYGMSALPLNLIKGTRNAAYERLENTEDIEEVEQHIQAIRSKSKDGRPLPARDRRTLKQCEERLRTLRKRDRHLEFIENSWWTKFCGALRPLKLYKIRRGRTRPQALLFLCMILLLIVLHTSYMIYSLAPQYVMYGSQNYLIESNITSDVHKGNSTLSVPKRCDADAPEDQCTVTRTYLFLHKFWFFSAAYYFGNWAFLGVFLIGLIVSCCKGKKSVIEGVDEDSDMSDDEPSVYSV
ncbi:putative lysosomal cobalamin transporter [Microtus ochrogaster]|uniref:Lysosomal cobalamin transport escort protein LMBD1 n=1 Tax=Microtus ochrogaster TaxID=79684 RepID=A0A8J6G6M6_MICOH|nr:putative lysosomal cobalamin transporter [Microtus ochrogaster]